MVRQNQIQLFMESADGSIVNAYTEEECKVFKMARRKVEITTENYFKGENTILDTYLDRRGALSIGLVMCRVMSIVKQTIVAVCLTMILKSLKATVSSLLGSPQTSLFVTGCCHSYRT